MSRTNDRPFIESLLPFLAFSALSEFAPIYPMYLIMFAGRGMDYAELSLLLVVWNFPAVALELPSGILADRWSKRGVLAIGMALKALAFLAWILAPGFAGACLGFVLWGCESALSSGARQALLYEALRARGRESRYLRAAGLSGAVGTAALLASEATGGFVYALGPDLALGLSSAAAAAGALVALFLGRGGAGTRSGAAPSGEAGGPAEAPGPTTRERLAALRDVIRSRSLGALVAAAAVAGAAFGTVDEYDGLWAMGRYGVPLAAVGLWAVLPFGATGLGEAASGSLGRLLDRRGGRGLPLALLAAGLAFLAAVLLPGRSGAAPYLLYYFSSAALSVLFEGRLQAVAPDGSRATLLSLSNLLLTLGAMLLSPLFGLAASAGGLAAAFALVAGLTIAAAAFLGLGHSTKDRQNMSNSSCEGR